MKIDDIKISEAIIKNYSVKLLDSLDLEVALVGGGPSNLVAGIILGQKGIKTAVFESKLAPGGGMWGGGIMLNEIVVQETVLPLLQNFGIKYQEYDKGYFTLDSIESTSTLISQCTKAGTKIFNLIKVVDVMFRDDGRRRKVNGLVIQWNPVDQLDLHIDPLTIRANYIVDGTGHLAEICTIVTKKMGEKLDTRTGKIIGEMSMWADRGEELTVKNSSEIFPHLYVVGMAANAAKGGPRMGPVFGGMILSGQKIARELIKKLRG